MLEIHFTSQPARAVCVEIDTEPRKTLVYGTVLPWHSDPGEGSARGWEEFDRVVELQGADWLRLRRKYPDHLLCVAGDFNQVLDGASPAGYGSTSGRQHLRRLMEDSNLRCLTDEWFVKTEKLAARRNIDHICASSGNVRAVHAWEGFEHHDGKIVELSDHNGVMIDLEV